MDSKEKCAICLAALNATQGQALFTAECSHIFHFTCVASNVQHGNYICPTCRATWVNLPSQFTPTYAPNLHNDPTFTPLLFADDETLPSPSPSPVAPSSTPQYDDSMTVKALPEYPALSKSYQSNSFPVLIAIQAPPLPPEASDRPSDRAPIDLIAVLDVSGSMNGDKIRLLKQAVRFVVDNLGPTDRLSIITFSTTAWRVTPLRRMNEAGKSGTIRAVNNLRADGSTNIIAGLKLAVQVLIQRREKNPVSSIILLSDGQDNQNGYGSSFLHSLRDLPPCIRANDVHLPTNTPQRDAVPVYTFGFGADHDATALHAIADGSGGTFSYIESIEIIQDAFARCIGGLLSVISQELEIHLSSVSQGVLIGSISSGRYRNNIDSGGLHGIIYVGEVFAEEEKKFLAYLSVPHADTETSHTQLLEVKCSYKDPLSDQYIMSEIVSVKIRRPIAEDLSEEDRQVSLEVDRERNRVSIAEWIAKAQVMAERGDLSSAKAMLQQRRMELMQSASAQAGDPLCGQLVSEMSEIQQRMSSRSEYERGGRAYTYSRTSAHMSQRASTQAVRSHQMPTEQFMGLLLNATATPLVRKSAPVGGAVTTPIVSSSAPPGDQMDYQTSSMRRMVQKSQLSIKPENQK